MDSSHCVSKREFMLIWNMPGPKSYRFSQDRLEQRWEVARHRKRFPSMDDHQSRAYLYALCDNPEGFVIAAYDLKTDNLYGMWMGTDGLGTVSRG